MKILGLALIILPILLLAFSVWIRDGWRGLIIVVTLTLLFLLLVAGVIILGIWLVEM